ncbi:hypothetical protein KUH03_22925 [Sphingobacterium sp. E70]|nr:hypothetical protein [Sphingobacterium sp. E70]ULT22299.1 hypothetical protein KUH03_22925 [Sphingobacterium sp. E70]
MDWYRLLMRKYQLPHYLRMDQPDRYVMQMRYMRMMEVNVILSKMRID